MKKLNVDLFEVWYIFEYKNQEHIVVYSWIKWVTTVNLEYDDEFSFIEDNSLNDLQFRNDVDNSIYFIDYADIEEDAYWSDNFNLLINE